MDHIGIYQTEMPAFLEAYTRVPAVERLRGTGMNCGCEYTSFSRFSGLKPYSRNEHSVGVALIIWHFTGNRAQTAAGLLHDAATPAFAHVVDFLNGDYLRQESTEAGTRAVIEGSPELTALLARDSLAVADVCDYHLYPVADNDAPRLSADRLEYSLGNMINFGICPAETAKGFFDDLTVGFDEMNREEIMFRTRQTAEAFAFAALACSRIYVSDEDRYAMQILAEILRYALNLGILKREDLYTTEPAVIGRLRGDGRTLPLWDGFRAMDRTVRKAAPDAGGTWRRIEAKKRLIDPMVEGEGRVSTLSPAFAEAMKAFLAADFDYWISAVPPVPGLPCL